MLKNGKRRVGEDKTWKTFKEVIQEGECYLVGWWVCRGGS